MIPSDVLERPWQTVGSDLFELNGSNYLLVVDYLPAFWRNRQIEQHFFSLDCEQFEIHICTVWNSRNSHHRQLDRSTRHKCSMHLLMIMDSFTEQLSSSPWYPQSTGVAERAVKTIKGLLKKARTSLKHFSRQVKSLEQWLQSSWATDGAKALNDCSGSTSITGFTVITFPRCKEGTLCQWKVGNATKWEHHPPHVFSKSVYIRCISTTMYSL